MSRMTTINVKREDVEKLRSLRMDRVDPPPKKSLGRGPSSKETYAEVFTRAVDALNERQNNKV